MSVDVGDAISGIGTLITIVSLVWYLRGALSKISISLISIDAGLTANRDLSVENKTKADAAHRRLDDHSVRIAVIESKDE